HPGGPRSRQDTVIDAGRKCPMIRSASRASGMKMPLRRLALAAALSLMVAMVAVGGILVAGTAHALPALGMRSVPLPVPTGSMSFSGDRHDSVTRGLSYSYSTSGGDTFSIEHGDLPIYADADTGIVQIHVGAANGDWWFLVFMAPKGQA